MTDIVSKEERSRVMSAIRSRGNQTTELKLIQIMRASGITGWRRNYKLTGSPDFVFPKARLAVFVDGCFWHGCPKHCRMPKSRQDYWVPKIERNVARDNEVKKVLVKRGWRVIRIWEHSLAAPQGVVSRLRKALIQE